MAKRLGQYDGDLQMFIEPKFLVELVYGKQEGVEGDVIVDFKPADDCSPGQFKRFMTHLGFMRYLVAKGEAGPKTRALEVTTPKQLVTAIESPDEQPTRPAPPVVGVQTHGEYGYGPSHPDYDRRGGMHQDLPAD